MYHSSVFLKTVIMSEGIEIFTETVSTEENWRSSKTLIHQL